MREHKRRFLCTFCKKSYFFVFFIVLVILQALTITTSAEESVYRSVKTDTKQIAFTFDDGPHPHLTEEILKILDQYQVKATFFMIGQNVKNYPDVANEVIKAGHEIGNHTYSHVHLERLNDSQVAREIEACDDALEELCEYRPHLFRPPEGAINERIQNCANHEDYSLILWSIDTRDWECKDENEIVNTVLNSIQPGDIILMHDYIGRKSRTPQALKILLPKLIEQGYEPVTVSQLLGFS